jgi:uncharacterized protein (TIGR00730 family)
MIKTICVFCGSSLGNRKIYADAAASLGEYLLEHNISLVYGGANVGLMRILADTVLSGGGEVTGVMPRGLADREVAHGTLTRMHIVDGMQARKALMADLSDGFIALPGAYGTLDELFEILSWNQLSIISKPAGILNTGGFYDNLTAMLGHSEKEGFLRPEHRKMLIVEKDIETLFRMMEKYEPVPAPEWIENLKKGKI